MPNKKKNYSANNLKLYSSIETIFGIAKYFGQLWPIVIGQECSCERTLIAVKQCFAFYYTI